MKTNIKALELIEKGMTAKTVSKLTESQVNILYSKLFLSEQVKKVSGKKIETKEMLNVKQGSPEEAEAKAKNQPFNTYEGEMDEDVEVSNDPNKETETQDPKQVGPSSDDGFGNENDGDMSEGKKDGPNPWAICHSQVGPKKSRKWERCVREVKKQLGEGKNPVSLFLENEIMKIVERNILPRITKGDLIKHLNEEENFATKHLQSFGTKSSPKVKKEVDEQNPSTAPTTKPAPTKPGTKTPPKPRPSHPGKNPNPGEKDAPKAQKTSPEKAKNEIIDVIIKMLEK
jgi:hypothetical protein